MEVLNEKKINAFERSYVSKVNKKIIILIACLKYSKPKSALIINKNLARNTGKRFVLADKTQYKYLC